MIERRSTVPTDHGHDLAPVYGDSNLLWITSGTRVYIYDKTTKGLTDVFPGSDIIIQRSVKGVGNFYDGSLVLTTPDGVFKSWTTTTINYYPKIGEKHISIEVKSSTGAFYKVRVWSSDYQ